MALVAVVIGVALLSSAGPVSASVSVPQPPVAPTPPVGPSSSGASSGSDLGPSVDRTTTPADRIDTPTVDDSTTTDSSDSGTPDASVNVSFPNVTENTSNSVVIILILTVLSLAPSLLVLCTSFTRIVIVLSLTRNALGLPTIPPQQVVVGLSVFLTLFVMGPTFTQMKDVALDPLLDGQITTSQALENAQGPLREFLLSHTREGELQMFMNASGNTEKVTREEVPLTALVPAFVLSELKSGFIIGFVIFVPFLIIDLVVSAVLMGLGMMMLPPSFVSLPFKILLFVMLDGWMLVVGTLLNSYR
jgi:flagellar biosynthesis protein FliP